MATMPVRDRAGLAQAGGPLCVDVVIRDHEVKGSVSHDVDYVNGFDLSEAWRVVNNVSDFKSAFPRGLTVVADFFVDVPILVTASRKGQRYLTRDVYLKKFKDLIDAGFDMRIVAYNFKKYKLQTMIKPALLKTAFLDLPYLLLVVVYPKKKDKL